MAWTEQTTTSPSGQHLGHLKVLQSRGTDNPTSEEGKLLATQQKLLGNTQVEMANHAIRHQYRELRE
eukprot:2683418-Ditylum_brightwellii.AAC.1